MGIEPDSLVDNVMREWPATIRAFLDFRMACVGCPIACFHTVADACREHGVDASRFLQALRAAAGFAAPPEARQPASPASPPQGRTGGADRG